MLTVKQARKVLGIESSDLSDEEIEVEIEIASYLKELFFETLLKNSNHLIHEK